MKKIGTRQSGFIHHLLTFLLVVLLVVGGVGYYVWHRHGVSSLSAKAESYAFGTTVVDSSGVTLKVCRLGGALVFLVDTTGMSPASTNLIVGFSSDANSNPTSVKQFQMGRALTYKSVMTKGSHFYATLGAEIGNNFGVMPAVSSVASCL